MKKLAIILVLALCIAILPGCGSKDTITLNVLNWGDYIDEEVLAQFEDENPGIKINYTTTASNEEMFVKLSAADSIYDICFPSDYIIEKMVANDMLHEINKDNIPNLANIDERFMDLSFDPGNKYSVPYMWGTVGILYNTTLVNEPVTSWSILWDEAYSKQILMYDSLRDSIGVTLKMLGYSVNTRDEQHIKEAEAALIAQKPMVQAYLGDSIKDKMILGEAALAVVYSGDAVYCIEENPDLAYAVPMEGSNIWFDNVIIPKTSKNYEAAELFINFLCDADVAKANTEYIGFSTPNKAAFLLLDGEAKQDETYNPPQDVIDRCEVFLDLGDFIEIYNSTWNRVNAVQG